MSDREARATARALLGGALTDPEGIASYLQARARAGTLLASPTALVRLAGTGAGGRRHPWKVRARFDAGSGRWWAICSAVGLPWWARLASGETPVAALHPATDRGVVLWCRQRSLMFLSAGELVDFVAEQATALREARA